MKSVRDILWVAATVCLLLLPGCDFGTDAEVDRTPPGPVEGLAASIDGSTVRLTWTEPADPDVAGSLLARFPASGIDAAPEAKRTYATGEELGSGTVLYSGPAAAVTDAPVCTPQLYAAWAADRAGNWSVTPRSVAAGALEEQAPTGAVASLTAVIDGRGVDLSWSVPVADSDVVVRVVRSLKPPLSPEDGATVFVGESTAATDSVPFMHPRTGFHYAAYTCTPCGLCAEEPVRVSITPTLREALQFGGFVVFWRHALATVCADQTDLGNAATTRTPGWWRSCDRNCDGGGATATARQLAPEGYQDAAAIGAALKAHGIAFDQVITSEFCRCRETAERMDLGPMIETSADLTFFVYDEATRCASTSALFTKSPVKGTNTAIVGHSLGSECVAIPSDLASGEAAVYYPDGMGGYELVGRVLPTQWAGLR